MLLCFFEHYYRLSGKGKFYLVSRYDRAPSSSNPGFRIFYRMARTMSVDLGLHNDNVPMRKIEQNRRRTTRDGMAKLRLKYVRCVSVLYKGVHPLTHEVPLDSIEVAE